MKNNNKMSLGGKTKINRSLLLIISLVLTLGMTTACSAIGSAQQSTDSTKLESAKTTESIIPVKPDGIDESDDIDEPDDNSVIDNSSV